MSDVAYSPPPAAPASAPAPSAPAPSQGEAVINPNPVNAPTPVGSQAPPAPPKSPQDHATGRRDSIKKAFDRSGIEAAKPRMGHNQPPEPMQREKLDLKKPPPKGDVPSAGPSRGEHGHFAPREGSQPPTQAGANRGQPGAQQPQYRQAAPLPQNAPYRAPPPRMAAHAQAEWAAAPESVRGEVYRMHREFSDAYRRYARDHQTMRSIRPFARMAKAHGTTLKAALTNYTGMEAKLRSDPVGGLDVIVNNLNLRAPDGQRIGLRDIAWHVLNQTPDQHRQLQTQNTQTAQSHQMAQLHQMVQGLVRQNQHMQYQQKFAHKRSEVDRFAEAHPRLDELGDLIAQELRYGFDLPMAYRRAELLRPATHAAQTRTQTAQTRNSDRSIRGAPDSGPSNGSGRRASPSASSREAVARAIRHVNGGL